MKANPLACVLLLLFAVAVQLPAQQPVSPSGTNATATNKPRLLPDFGETNTDANDILVEAQRRYDEDARTNHITLDKPRYTNAPWSEIRLRTSALVGNGLAASLCSGSNSTEQLFWLRLAATNGWLPSQVELAKDCEYERPKDTKPGAYTWEEVVSPELEDIQKLPKDVRLTTAQLWWSNAKTGLPKLKDDATHNDARAIYALGLLHESGDLVESNTVIAAEMFHKAAALGLAPAQRAYACLCEWYLTNHVEAANWYYQAATQGLIEAQSSLSLLHDRVSLVLWGFDPRFQPKARERARWVFEEASQPIACLSVYSARDDLGEIYLRGLGVESNAVEAVKWYRRAIDLEIVSNGGTAEYNLALCYFGGDGVPQDDNEGMKWVQNAVKNGYKEDRSWESQLAGDAYDQGDYNTAVKYWRKNAAQGEWGAQFNLGIAFRDGNGVVRDGIAAAQWFQKVAAHGATEGATAAQFNLGVMYYEGQGVPQDYAEALKWYRKAANQSDIAAQNNLGVMYEYGRGVPQDYIEAYRWYNLAAAHGDTKAINNRDEIASHMTPSQIAEAQRLSREFKPRQESGSNNSNSPDNPTATGTGFFITDDGYLISNYHVVKDAAQVRLLTRAGTIPAKVVTVDEANDIALLKAEGKFSPLPIAASRTVRLGNTVATVGFPDIGLQGFAPKLAKGEIASLSGAADDPRYFQISVPVQPGNSGGALVDERGNVVGIVSAKLSARAALAESGALPENVNYAVKSSFLLGFLESMPDVSAKLKEPHTQDEKFEDVVKSAQQAAVLVLVY